MGNGVRVTLSIIMFLVIYKPLGANGLYQNITVHFAGMSSNINQKLYLRVVDKGTMKETARTTQLISTSSFDVSIDAVEPGRSYFIDFFVDVNENSLYNVPPIDQAWRLELNDAMGNDELQFNYNNNFTDIDWSYQLIVHFYEMSGHIDELLELRVVNNSTNLEIDRIKLDTIKFSQFDMSVVGIKHHGAYTVEFYTDHNGNGKYDPPPFDHAWVFDFGNSTGDVELDFIHNANFIDIGWRYLYTLELADMSEHLDQLFELRVVRTIDNVEIGRRKVSSILVDDFTIFIDGLEIGNNYEVDFYADNNLNGTYDPPPTDHSWRITLENVTGDEVQQFAHNTNFTDIQWPNPSSVNNHTDGDLNTFYLFQNYPNPFNPSTTINFSIPEASFVSLRIFNSLGQGVETLVSKELSVGNYKYDWNAKEFTSGIYFYTIQAGDFVGTKKMILLK